MRSWTKEKIYHNGDEYFSDLEESITQARKSIDLEVYIFRWDSLGEKILHRLQAAARSGVRVRLLVDGLGSASSISIIERQLEKSRVEFHVYHRLPRMVFSFLLRWKTWFNLKPRKVMNFLGKLNRRNHRKSCLIDRKIAYVGGMNISSVQLKEYSGDKAWRDTSVRVTGPEITSLVYAFEKAWGSARVLFRSGYNWKVPKRRVLSLVRLNDTARRRRSYHRELIDRILMAEKTIWITNPYFVPTFFMIRALRLAAWSGVDVQILLPRKNDIFFMKWVNRAFYRVLLKAGVQIFEYQPSTLHAKVIIIDHLAFLGSSNRNQRSLIHDLEVDLILTHPSSLSSLKKQFILDLSHSHRVFPEKSNRWYWLQNWKGKVILFFRHWL